MIKTIVGIVVIAGLLCAFHPPAYAVSDEVMQFLIELGATETAFGLAVNEHNAARLDSLKTTYHDLREDLAANPNLQGQLDYIYHMCGYKSALCDFYAYEFTADGTRLDRALAAFTDFARNAPDSIGLLGTYMAAEAKYLAAERRQFPALDDGAPAGEYNKVKGIFTESQQIFADFAAGADRLALFIDAAGMRAAALTRIADIRRDLARLALAKGDDQGAIDILREIDYTEALKDGALPEALQSYIEYSELVIRQDTAMLRRDGEALMAVDDALGNFPNLRDYEMRYALATIAGGGDVQQAIGRLRRVSSTRDAAEANYWIGCAHLINGDFDNARMAFDNFLEARESQEARLAPLRRRAERISTIVKFAQGREATIDKIAPLKYDDVKIILRILALTRGPQLDRVINVVEPIFEKPELFEWGQDEVRFFQGVLLSIRAEAGQAREDRVQRFERAAQKLEGVSGMCATEAAYIRGRALFFAEQYEQAKQVMKSLVNTNGSTRALFFTGEIFRIQNFCSDASRCYDSLLTALDNKTEYADFQFWKANARAGIGLCEGRIGDTTGFTGITLSGLKYPDYTYTLGDEPVTYETLALFEVVKARIATETIRQFIIWGIPKRILHPGPKPERMAIMDRYWPTYAAPVLITIPLNQKWNLCMQLVTVDKPQGISNAKVDAGIDSLPFDNGCYRMTELAYNAPVVFDVTGVGYYRMSDSIPAQWYGNYDTTLAVAKIVTYSPRSKDAAPPHIFRRDSLDYDAVMIDPGDPFDLPQQLRDDFSNGIAVRDFAYDPAGKRFLAVDNSLHDAVRIYNGSESTGHLTLDFTGAKIDGLGSPEGIAVDSKGTIYIADWDNSRVVVFDNDGNYIGQFGEFGMNTLPNNGAAAKLAFPARIAIEEDFAGIKRPDGDPLLRQKHILVADRYGIHKFDAEGNYLDSPVRADKKDHPAGSFYAFTITGYGPSSIIQIIDRLSGKIAAFDGK